MFFRLLSETVEVELGDGTRVEVKGKSGSLLRLLLLWPVPKVPRALVCDLLEIRPTSVASSIAKLRDDLHNAATIFNQDGYVGVATDRDSSDASRLKSWIERGGLDEPSKETGPQIDAFVAAWRGQPTRGFSEVLRSTTHTASADAIGTLEALVSDWTDLYFELRFAHAKAKLASGTARDSKIALSELLVLANVPDPRDEVWVPLFQACTDTKDEYRHKQAWTLCVDHYRGELETSRADLLRFKPEDLTSRSPQVKTVDTETNTTIIELATVLGITTASALKMTDARLEPSDCINRTQRLLHFSGVLASKWVMDPGVRAEFEALLRRLDDPESEPVGEVKFLIMNPRGKAFERLADLRGGRISDESVPHLIALARKYQSFEVRAFDHLPSFRTIIIDDDIVSFSPYALEAEAYSASKRGWEAPHVTLDPKARWPLASAFRLHFDESWQLATPIEEIRK